MGQPGQSILSVQVSSRLEIGATKPEGQVAELIGRLASESAEQRRAAVQSLVEMGPAIEPQVRWAWQHEKPMPRSLFVSRSFDLDPDVLLPHHAFNELEVVLSHLEEQRQLQTSFVTLHYTNAVLSNVLADLGRQARGDISVGNLSPWLNLAGSLDWVQTNRVTAEVSRATYWEALERIERAGGLTEIFTTSLGHLLLTRAGRGVPPGQPFGPPAEPLYTNSFVVSGPLKISLVSAELAHSMTYSDGRRSTRLKLVLKGQAEPKFWNTGENALLEVDTCVDDQGRSLVAEASRTFPGVRARAFSPASWEVPVELGAPPPGGRIKTLKGRFSVELTVTPRYLCITNLMGAQGQSREFDNLCITVSGVSEKEAHDEICLEISAPTGSPYARTFADSLDWSAYCFSIFDDGGHGIGLAYMRGIWAETSVIFEDLLEGYHRWPPTKAGRRFNELRHEGGRDVISWNVFFAKQLKPTTLVWGTPAATRWLTVPFELHDLAMPAP
jgi:hypothetical protein